MPNVHSINKAQEFANAALERIQSFGIAPTPENYELWFLYHSESDPEMKKAVDSILKQNDGKISEEECYAVHQQFLSSQREEKTVRQAGDQIQKTIEDVNSAVVSAKKHAAKYGSSLQGVSKDLQNDKTKDEVQALVVDMMSNTKSMIDQNVHLEGMLENSARAMEDMRRDLEIARKEAMTDGLTGLSNRKAFDQEIARLADASNQEEPHIFSLILLDIDHFKKFNDTFGHQVGDQVLKLVARTLNEGVKGRDLTVRYGGEEFAILLPETNIQGGLKVAEILRQEVEKKEVINRSTGKKLAKITLSAGVSQYFKGEETDKLVGRADKALYEAKNAGRNQVISAMN